MTVLNGLLGMTYCVMLLQYGKPPGDLVHVMPIAGGIAFAILLTFWLRSMRRHRHAVQH